MHLLRGVFDYLAEVWLLEKCYNSKGLKELCQFFRKFSVGRLVSLWAGHGQTGS